MSHVDRQAIAEARLLDVEILLQHLELVLQRHFLDVRRIQRHAQQIAEAVHHPIGGVDVVRIRPEMVFSVLNRKCGCSCRCSAWSCASTSRVSRCAPSSARRSDSRAVLERVREADQEQIRHQQPVELREVFDLRRRTTSRGPADAAASAAIARDEHRSRVNAREYASAPGEVDRERRPPVAAAELVPRRHAA